MVSQRARQARLGGMLADLGLRSGERPPAPRLDTMPAEAVERILSLFHELGGVGEGMVPFRPGVWDLPLAGGLLVELDEEQHFNRYRGVTLAPAWVDPLPWAEDYRRYSAELERAALRKARGVGYWSSPSTEAMFGPAAPPGDFSGGGAPRWKQRALYDAMRDALAASGEVRLARVAIWDELGDTTLGRILDGRGDDDAASRALDDLAELLATRTS